MNLQPAEGNSYAIASLASVIISTYRHTWSVTWTPYPNRTHRLPSILSQEEVAQFIDAALTPFHHTVLMTLYGSGVRNAELTHLKVTDIDSQRMVIHIQGGKGRKDRDVMLSQHCSKSYASTGTGCRPTR